MITSLKLIHFLLIQAFQAEEGGGGDIKGTLSPAERCHLVGVKLEQVHQLFVSLSYLSKMAQYGLLYDERLCK